MTQSDDERLPTLLSVIAGSVDVIGYLSLGLFTANVTGNLVVIAALLERGGPPNLTQILAVPVFIAAVAAVWLIAEAADRRGPALARPLLLVHFLLLCCVLIFTVTRDPAASPHGWLAGIAAMICSSRGHREHPRPQRHDGPSDEFDQRRFDARSGSTTFVTVGELLYWWLDTARRRGPARKKRFGELWWSPRPAGSWSWNRRLRCPAPATPVDRCWCGADAEKSHTAGADRQHGDSEPGRRVRHTLVGSKRALRHTAGHVHHRPRRASLAR